MCYFKFDRINHPNRKRTTLCCSIQNRPTVIKGMKFSKRASAFQRPELSRRDYPRAGGHCRRSKPSIIRSSLDPWCHGVERRRDRHAVMVSNSTSPRPSTCSGAVSVRPLDALLLSQLAVAINVTQHQLFDRWLVERTRYMCCGR